jgi:hypothetical protein
MLRIPINKYCSIQQYLFVHLRSDDMIGKDWALIDCGSQCNESRASDAQRDTTVPYAMPDNAALPQQTGILHQARISGIRKVSLYGGHGGVVKVPTT